jgi:metal transporter CNNM
MHKCKLTQFMIVLFFVITKPMATLLDYALGKELGTIYSTQELITMLKLHEESDVVDKQQSNALIGALQYKDMLVSEVMTPVAQVYMLRYDTTLSFKTLREIFQTGFSRIPGIHIYIYHLFLYLYLLLLYIPFYFHVSS